MKLRNMTRCAIFSAVLAVCAWLSIPLGDQAISLQSFGVFLTLFLLGGRDGTVSVLVYLLLGVVGVPVFSGIRGGISVLLGPTGGYLWGFLAAAILYWVLEKRLPSWMNTTLSMMLCYTCGTVWYYFIFAPGALWPVLLTCVVPYLLPDILKIFLAHSVARRLKTIVE